MHPAPRINCLWNTTTVDNIWRKAPCNTWYNLGYFLGWRRKRNMQESGAWQVSTAVWNDGLRTALATHAILWFCAKVFSRKGLGLNFDKDELVVVVCAAIRRVVGPFQVVDSLLSNRHALAQSDLEVSTQRMCKSDSLATSLAPTRSTQFS